MSTILVTGATGNVGAEIIKQFATSDHRVLAGARNPAQTSVDPIVEQVRFDFADHATFASALHGVTRLFLMRPPALVDVQHYFVPVIEAARDAGVEQIVFLSVLGAEKIPWIPHRRIELAIEQADVPYTFLRAGFFDQNLSTVHRDEIKKHRAMLVPAGTGKTSFIDVRDIAAVAVKCLTEKGHHNRAYPLTGQESLDYFEVSQVFSDVLGRSITYPNPSLFAYINLMRLRGLSIRSILFLIGIYLPTRLNLVAHVTPDTERILGRPPITMRQFVEDYRDVWA